MIGISLDLEGSGSGLIEVISWELSDGSEQKPLKYFSQYIW